MTSGGKRWRLNEIGWTRFASRSTVCRNPETFYLDCLHQATYVEATEGKDYMRMQALDSARQLVLRNRRRWIALGVFLAISFGIIWLNSSRSPSLTAPTGRPAGATEYAANLPPPSSVSATGKIEPISQVSVGSEISGKIAEVYVDFNDSVEASQVLARFQTDYLEATVAEAKATLKASMAEVAQAEATKSEAEARQARKVKLAQEGLVSNQQIEEVNVALARAVQQVIVARSKLEAQQATLQVAQSRLDRAVIVSPIDGVVLDRLVEPGQTVAAGLEAPSLFVIAKDLKQIQIRALVDESDIGLVRQGQSVKFWVDAFPGRVFSGAVRSIRRKPTTIQNVVFYEVIVDGSNPDESLLLGMTATLKIDVSSQPGAVAVADGP